MRMRAIANALDGYDRKEAARLEGMSDQALRDAIKRYNEEGLAGLNDLPKPGRPRKLDAAGEAELSKAILAGPDAETDGICAYTLDDLAALVEKRWSVKAATSRKLFLAQKAMTMQKWEWFQGAGVARNRDERDLMPRLLFGLYLAHKEGRGLTKGDVARLANLDRATTGPKYIARLAALGLVTILDRPPEDRRKDFVIPTDRLIEPVEAELPRAARLLLFLISPRRQRR